MLDIETLSTKNNALILTIGAIKWDRKGAIREKIDMNKFYKRINIESSKKLGLDIDENTLLWWKKQNEEVRFDAFENKEDRIDLEDALKQFIEWYGNAKCVWANGDDFDCVIMNNAFEICNLTPPWKFWETRDVRTLYDIGNIKNYMLNKLKLKQHNAIDDCYKQIYGCKLALNKINNTLK